MEIKILLFIWGCLGLFGLMLISFRPDVDKFINEANFIMKNSILSHKITYILLAIIFLPLTIPSSIEILLKN